MWDHLSAAERDIELFTLLVTLEATIWRHHGRVLETQITQEPGDTDSHNYTVSIIRVKLSKSTASWEERVDESNDNVQPFLSNYRGCPWARQGCCCVMTVTDDSIWSCLLAKAKLQICSKPFVGEKHYKFILRPKLASSDTVFAYVAYARKSHLNRAQRKPYVYAEQKQSSPIQFNRKHLGFNRLHPFEWHKCIAVCKCGDSHASHKRQHKKSSQMFTGSETLYWLCSYHYLNDQRHISFFWIFSINLLTIKSLSTAG